MNPPSQATMLRALMANISLPELGVSAGTDRDRSWIDGSQLCEQTDPGAYFDEPGEREEDARANRAAAEAICRRCPLIEPCLRYSLLGDEWGTWGGRGERWRKRTRKRIKAGETTVDAVVAAELEHDPTATAAA